MIEQFFFLLVLVCRPLPGNLVSSESTTYITDVVMMILDLSCVWGGLLNRFLRITATRESALFSLGPTDGLFPNTEMLSMSSADVKGNRASSLLLES